MFILENKEQLEKAEKKARKVNPEVKFISDGRFLVKGSKGDFYQVVLRINENGEKVVSCACQTSDGNVCYHTVFPIFMQWTEFTFNSDTLLLAEIDEALKDSDISPALKSFLRRSKSEIIKRKEDK